MTLLLFRTFGLFAALSLAINYVLLISFLPAILLLQRRHIDPFFDRIFNFNLPINENLDNVKQWADDLIDHHFPAVLIHGRFVWLSCLTLLVCCCGWLSATRLHLPQYNPLQLFVASNPSESY